MDISYRVRRGDRVSKFKPSFGGDLYLCKVRRRPDRDLLEEVVCQRVELRFPLEPFVLASLSPSR
jgi:hypothetical protein